RPRGIPRRWADKTVHCEALLALELLRNPLRLRPIEAISGTQAGPAALEHLPLPSAQVLTIAVVARHRPVRARPGTEVVTLRQRELRGLRSRWLRLLAAVDRTPRVRADNPVSGQTV